MGETKLIKSLTQALNEEIALSFEGQDAGAYRDLTPDELEKAIQTSLDYLAKEVQPSGSQYLTKWEAGWGENLANLRQADNASDITDLLTPKFVKKNLPAKIRGRWVMPYSDDFEMWWVSRLRELLASSYLKDVKAIYEFGAGTGHNLLHFSSLLPGVDLRGYDWSENSVAILNEISARTEARLEGRILDLFNPIDFSLEHKSSETALITMGTVEQLGGNFRPCLNLILENRFAYVIHMETAYELYDPKILVDFLSMKYLEKRDWSQGYFSELHRLEAEGRVEIIEQERTFGSFFHEGYTVTVWRPISEKSGSIPPSTTPIGDQS